jgi:hypothetical protein
MQASVRLSEKSRTACAITSWRDRVYLSWAGAGAKLNLASSPDGRELADVQRLPYRSYYYDRSSMDDSFSDIVITSPAIAAVTERLYLAWTGKDRRINLLAATAREYSAPAVHAQRSSCSPSVSVPGHGGPVLAWTGKDRRINLLTLPGRQLGSNLRLEQARTHSAPAVCSHQGNLVLAWTGTDRHINLLTLPGQQLGSNLRLEQARTHSAPAVCSHQGNLVLAWTGTDAHINLASL